MAADLSESHVGQVIRGTIAGISADRLRRLADAAGVRFEWLASGEGPMEDRSAPQSGGGPAAEPAHRAEGAEQARRAGVWEVAIRDVLAQPARPEDLDRSAAWWAAQMVARQEELLDEADRFRQRRPSNTGEIPKVQRTPPAKPSAPASGRRPSAPPSDDDPFAPDPAPSSRAPVHESGELVREIDPDQAQEITGEQKHAAMAAAKKKAKS